MQRQDLPASVRVFVFQESLQRDDLYKYTCNSNDYFVNFRTAWLTWGLEHLTWTGCRSTWRQTTKECLPSEQLCSLWDVTASVEVQPIGSNRLRLCCCPSNVYMLNWLRLIVHGKASPGGRHRNTEESSSDVVTVHVRSLTGIRVSLVLINNNSISECLKAEDLWMSHKNWLYYVECTDHVLNPGGPSGVFSSSCLDLSLYHYTLLTYTINF